MGFQLPNRLLHGIVATFSGQFLNIAGNLLLVPLFLSRWSSGVYGEWIALSAVVAYFGVTDLGVNSAAGNAMTAAYARSDLRRYRHVQASAMAFYVGMALVASLLFGVMVLFLPVTAWIGIRHLPQGTADSVAWLLAARLLWQMPAAQLASIYRTTGNLGATQWFGNIQSIALVAVTVIVLLSRGDVIHVAAWGVVPMIVVTAGVWLSLRRSHPELLPRLSEARLADLHDLFAPSLLFAGIVLAQVLAIQGPVLLVSNALGGTAVAVLVTTRTLANVVRQVVGPVQVALWPELTRLDAVRAEATLRLGHRLLVTGCVALCAAFAGTLWFEGSGVIVEWTRGRLTPDVWLLRLFLLALVLQAPWLASSLFTIANNRHGPLAISWLSSAIIALAVLSFALPHCGLIAVPLSAIIGEAFACYHFVAKDACQVLAEDYRPFVGRVWTGVAATSCIAWTAGYLGHSFAFGPIGFRWIEVGALTTVATGFAAWTFALQRDDRLHLARWGARRWAAVRPGRWGVPA